MALADDLELELQMLDAECERGIDDPVWLFERTEKVAKRAIAELRNPSDHRPDHDSLVVKFDQLERALDSALAEATLTTASRPIREAGVLLGIIRAMVLK